jgi:DNA repair photolyase
MKAGIKRSFNAGFHCALRAFVFTRIYAKLAFVSNEKVRGRGASSNPPNRFEKMSYETSEWDEPEDPSRHTVFLKDDTRTIINYNDSPDVGFNASINPYRGCEHGCIYCFARPNHEYLGLSAGLDFETKILVKEDAPQLLRRELSSPRWEPQIVAISGVTDAYQPIERRLQLTRRCLEVFFEYRNPVVIITKNDLVVRDIDLLKELAKIDGILVFVSVTSLDSELARELEPRASHPAKRLAAIAALAEARVPVGSLIAPVIPGLTDHEMPAIISAIAQAGAVAAGYVPLRLPYGVAPLFEEWLTLHRPLQKEKILGRIREIRGGKLNDPNFGTRMQGSGPYAEHISEMFEVCCRKARLNARRPKLSVKSFRRPGPAQLPLF